MEGFGDPNMMGGGGMFKGIISKYGDRGETTVTKLRVLSESRGQSRPGESIVSKQNCKVEEVWPGREINDVK